MAEPQARMAPFTIGDIVPSFNLTSPDGTLFDIGGDDSAGHFRVLLFGAGEAMATAHRRLGEKRAALRQTRRAPLCGVTRPALAHRAE